MRATSMSDRRICSSLYHALILKNKTKWRKIWIWDVFWSKHLGCWGQKTSRMQNKEVYAALGIPASAALGLEVGPGVVPAHTDAALVGVAVLVGAAGAPRAVLAAAPTWRSAVAAAAAIAVVGRWRIAAAHVAAHAAAVGEQDGAGPAGDAPPARAHNNDSNINVCIHIGAGTR